MYPQYKDNVIKFLKKVINNNFQIQVRSFSVEYESVLLTSSQRLLVLLAQGTEFERHCPGLFHSSSTWIPCLHLTH
jgi:hypothetical protein